MKSDSKIRRAAQKSVRIIGHITFFGINDSDEEVFTNSDTSRLNILGVSAVVVPGGFYPGGLPFGLEISARSWHDGDLLGYSYTYEQQTPIAGLWCWSRRDF